MHFLCLARCQLGFLLRQFELFKLPVEKQNAILRKEIDLVSRQRIHIHAGVPGSQMFRLFCDSLGYPDPVSYTHLDVDKRQVYLHILYPVFYVKTSKNHDIFAR